MKPHQPSTLLYPAPSVTPRARSYHDILKDIKVHARGGSMASSVAISFEAVTGVEDRWSDVPQGSARRARGRDVHHNEGEEIHDGLQEKAHAPAVACSAPIGNSHSGRGKLFQLMLGARTRGRNAERGSSTRPSLMSSRGVRPPGIRVAERTLWRER